MYNKDGVYNLFRELREFIKKPTPSKYKKMLTNSFEWYTQHYYTGTPRWADGAITFIPLSNDLNSGQISLIAVCSAFIGNWILKNKLLTYKEVNEVDKIREIAKFYSVLETRKHFQYIEELEENSVDSLIKKVNLIVDNYYLNKSKINLGDIKFRIKAEKIIGN